MCTESFIPLIELNEFVIMRENKREKIVLTYRTIGENTHKSKKS